MSVHDLVEESRSEQPEENPARTIGNIDEAADNIVIDKLTSEQVAMYKLIRHQERERLNGTITDLKIKNAEYCVRLKTALRDLRERLDEITFDHLVVAVWGGAISQFLSGYFRENLTAKEKALFVAAGFALAITSGYLAVRVFKKSDKKSDIEDDLKSFSGEDG